MNKEPIESDISRHPGFIYANPEGKVESTPIEKPEMGSLAEEIAWHQEQLALQVVKLEDDTEWTKDSLLAAIEEGHIDAFTKQEFRFPPSFNGVWITSFTALYFDDREFGDRIANTVLNGFNRTPRQPLG